MRINKLIILLLFFLVLCLSITKFVDAEWCKYQSEIEECLSANDEWTTRSIDDFECIVGTDEQVAYQVVLALLFKDLDDEMDEYIDTLEKDKNIYFWKDRRKNYVEGLNDIEDEKDYFYEEYSKNCWEKIIEQVVACNYDEETSIKNAKNYFQETDCMRLVDKKLEIFADVAYDIMVLNKKQLNADAKKTYDQPERVWYDRLLDGMMINLWYIERIWQKWPSKILDAY